MRIIEVSDKGLKVKGVTEELLAKLRKTGAIVEARGEDTFVTPPPLHTKGLFLITLGAAIEN